jgi:NAD(P)H-hydrate epimerase
LTERGSFFYHQNMLKALTAEQMREVDRLTTERCGITSLMLMENAANSVLAAIDEIFGDAINGKKILIFCGKGNNGGDGAALARMLARSEASVTVCLLGSVADTKGDARVNFERLTEIIKRGRLNAVIIEDKDIAKWPEIAISEFDMVVDAVFGTGLTRSVEGRLKEFVEHLASAKSQAKKTAFLSIDIPSGLDCDQGEPVGSHVVADHTVTFTAPKPANILASAYRHTGKLHVANIGSPPELVAEMLSHLYVSEKSDAAQWLRQTKFTSDSYKNKRGHTLIVAGSENYSGAAVLAADACMRSGVGLVTLAAPRSIRDSIAARVLPEVMTVALPETKSGAISEAGYSQLESLAQKAHCIAIGCGLTSNEETTRAFVEKVVANRKTPILIDADGLNALSQFQIKGNGKHPVILTPHIGEMRRLLGLKDGEDIGDIVPTIRAFAQKHQVIVVLKGERVLIAEPGGMVIVNPTGNSGLGKAGNGDTLAGILTGFLTQTFAIPKDENLYNPPHSVSSEISKALEAVIAGVYVAGMAGDIAESKYGKRVMTASDARECLSEAFAVIEGNDG